MVCGWVFISFINHFVSCFTVFDRLECSKKFIGPSFRHYPKSSQTFVNTETLRIRCDAIGKPKPEVRWWQKYPEAGGDVLVQTVTPLREVRHGGELLFLPFSSTHYRKNIHNTTYFCIASNALGQIRSPDIQLNTSKFRIMPISSFCLISMHNKNDDEV